MYAILRAALNKNALQDFPNSLGFDDTRKLALLMETPSLIKSTARYPSDATELRARTLACDVSWHHRLSQTLITMYIYISFSQDIVQFHWIFSSAVISPYLDWWWITIHGLIFVFCIDVTLIYKEYRFIIRWISSLLPVTLSYLPTTVTSYWARWRLKSPASPWFVQPFVQARIKENIKALHHWPLWGEFTGHRRISLTKGQ